MRVIILRGRVSIRPFCQGGCWDFFEGCSEDIMYYISFCFLSFLDILFLYIRSCDHFYTYIVLVFFIYVDVCFFHLPLHVLFIFSLCRHVSYTSMQSIIFVFTQRCLDEFCWKCFRNTGCQSLLAINSLLAKFLKSLCWEKFYCIQQVNMS